MALRLLPTKKSELQLMVSKNLNRNFVMWPGLNDRVADKMEKVTNKYELDFVDKTID